MFVTISGLEQGVKRLARRFELEGYTYTSIYVYRSGRGDSTPSHVDFEVGYSPTHCVQYSYAANGYWASEVETEWRASYGGFLKWSEMKQRTVDHFARWNEKHGDE